MTLCKFYLLSDLRAFGGRPLDPAGPGRAPLTRPNYDRQMMLNGRLTLARYHAQVGVGNSKQSATQKASVRPVK
jgi:hypothetical protein